MANTESMEMYLETIYLLEKSEGHAHGVEIAKKLGVSKASVTKFMNNLKDNGFIQKQAYGSITLTDSGILIAEKIYYNHRLITLYLKHSLNISDDEASKNACKMEHVLTDSLIESIEAYLVKNNIQIK